jgi:hypothetical protein
MGGADVTPITHDFQQLQFSQTVGKGESRIAAAAGIPSSWVGFSEGLQGSGLNSAGVYAAARRRFADGTIRPLWRMASASLAVLVKVPTGAELWYDEAGIAFLREDEQDRAEIMQTTMSSINTAIMAGFEPDAAVEAFRDKDVGLLLGKHTGLVSVQMMAPRSKEQERMSAQVFLTHAQAAQALALARFKPDSIAEAIETEDFSKLEEDESMGPMGQPQPDDDVVRPSSGSSAGGSSGGTRRSTGAGVGKPTPRVNPNSQSSSTSPKGAKE